jgi:hypothetical protein
MSRPMLNLFFVTERQYDDINDWVNHQMSLPISERMARGEFPAEFNENLRVAAQVALSRHFADQPYLVFFGLLAAVVVPCLALLSLFYP